MNHLHTADKLTSDSFGRRVELYLQNGGVHFEQESVEHNWKSTSSDI